MTMSSKEKRMSMTKRRVAVRAETEDDFQEDDEGESIPKSDEDIKSIKLGIKNNEIFDSLSDDQTDFLVKGFQKLGVETAEVVIQQGEAGDHFYVVQTGKFVVTLDKSANTIIKEYGPGESFGELALLYNSPRAATITCSEKGDVWAIERKRFRHVMKKSAKSVTEQNARFLQAVGLLSDLTDGQRTTLANSMEEIKYVDQEYIVAKGDVADAMYIIKAGEVAFNTGTGPGGEAPKDVARMKAGEVFGESCLEPTPEEAKRKANAIAVGPVVVLRLTAKVFKEQVGQLSAVLASNFKRKVLEGVEIDGTKVIKELEHDKLEEILEAMKETEYKAGEVVITQGKPNDKFCVIKSGSVKVMQRSPEGNVRELARLEQGTFFGERALLTGENATTDVVADDVHGAKIYLIHKADFDRTVGMNMKTLLDKERKKRDEAAAKPELPKFADLELRRILGVGTFGRVKLVVHKPTEVTYALKCMRKAQVVATKQQSHVLQEKNILAMMNHPFILRLVQTYQDAGELYMLEELALGGELFTLLAKRAPLFDSPARFYVASVVSMFSYMHSLKVIYRDLKPENLLLDGMGYLKLVDFGFAKQLQDRTWTLCGTPEYLAPEIILNKGHGFGADWWCVGILAFECLTGTTPFVSNDPMEGYRKIIKCRVPWPAQLSAAAKDFIDKLLTVDPTRRLGCLKNGSKDVKAHAWFAGSLDFKALEAKALLAPYVPKIKNMFDDSNFDTYTDEGKLNYPEEDFPREMFKEFAEEWV